MNTNEKIENLEIKLAELQRDMQAISESVILQQSQISQLKKEVTLLENKLEQPNDNLSFEKPPHY